MTLSQIIDVYTTLGHNDGSATVEPLYCSLSSRICLASQYAYLRSAANEGKTLMQILEASTVASYQSEEIEAFGDDQLEDDVIETQFQQDSADYKDESEPFREKAENPTSSKPDQDAELKFANDDAVAVSSRNTNDVEGESSHGSRSGPDEEINGQSQEEVRQERKPLMNSIVEKEQNDFKGDHESSFGICSKPDICSCSACASVSTGKAGPVSDKPEEGEIIEDLFSGDIKAAVISDLMESKLVSNENNNEKNDCENSLQESVSSRTLEAENNQLELDIFSEDEGHAFEDGTDYLGENHHEDFEDSLLKETTKAVAQKPTTVILLRWIRGSIVTI